MITSLQGPSGPLRVNYAVCFSDSKGQSKKSVEKLQTRLLTAATPILQPILEADEEVLYAAEAVSPYSVVELLMTGWIITTIKRCLLVVTNRRLLHLPIKPSLKPRGSIAEIRFGDAQSLEVKGALGKKLTVVYRGGKQEAFTIARREGAAKLNALLPQIARGTAMTAEPGRHFLCPRCARRQQAGAEQCPACGQAFKTRKRALFWSLVAPGGGYFYTGHTVLGLMDAVTEALLIIFAILGVVMGLEGEEGGWTIALTFGVLLAIEKLVTIYHANHYVAELMPAGPPSASAYRP